jgi:hypothetical protein
MTAQASVRSSIFLLPACMHPSHMLAHPNSPPPHTHSDMTQCADWHSMCKTDPSLWACYGYSAAAQAAAPAGTTSKAAAARTSGVGAVPAPLRGAAATLIAAGAALFLLLAL